MILPQNKPGILSNFLGNTSKLQLQITQDFDVIEQNQGQIRIQRRKLPPEKIVLFIFPKCDIFLWRSVIVMEKILWASFLSLQNPPLIIIS